MAVFSSSTYSKRLLHLISWGHWFTFFNIIAAILLSTFYIVAEPMPETLLGKVYLLATWVSHIGFITFISFVLTIFPLTLVYPRTRFIRVSASIIFTVGLLLLLLDAFIYNRLGYHLNASSSAQIIDLINSQIEQNSQVFWSISLVLCLSILSFQLVVSNYAWKHLRDLQKTVAAKFIVTGLVGAFFFSHLTHIWADANLEYDVLRQDTMLPLSYPSTAKTLLTKYKLFDLDAYNERKTSPLSFNQALPAYPKFEATCANLPVNQSTFVILSKQAIGKEQLEHFGRKSTAPSNLLTRHIDNALPLNSWFNLLYSLPTIYKEPLLKSVKQPILFDALSKNGIEISLNVVQNNGELPTYLSEYKELFSTTSIHQDISKLIFSNKLNELKPGLHFVYFNFDDTYQFELFTDALLLAQKKKSAKDNIWISSIGNPNSQEGLKTKQAMYIANEGKSKTIKTLTSQMDIQSTLMKQWLKCDIDNINFGNGTDITTLKKDRVIANTNDAGLVVFDKDQSVFIDQNGNFQSFSGQLNAPITINEDFPLLIDGVHFIKQFSDNSHVIE